MFGFKNVDQHQFKEGWAIFEEVRVHEGKRLSDKYESETSEKLKFTVDVTTRTLVLLEESLTRAHRAGALAVDDIKPMLVCMLTWISKNETSVSPQSFNVGGRGSAKTSWPSVQWPLMAEVAISTLVLSSLEFPTAKMKILDAVFSACKLTEVLEENIKMFQEIALELPKIISKVE